MNRIFLFNYDYRNIPDLNFAHYSLVYACGLYCKAAIMQRQSLFSRERCHTTPHENLEVWHWNFLAQFILWFTIKLSLALVHYFETGNAQQNGDLKKTKKNKDANILKWMGVAKNQITDVWEEKILPSIIINVHKLNRNAKCRYYRPSTTINCRWPTVKQH